jgi:uridine phosphorylase
LGTAGAASGLGAEGCGGQIHSPEHHQGGVRVDALGSKNAVDLGLVPAKVARGLGDAEAEDEGAATGAGHVVEARLGVEVMATAGAAADGGLLTAASVGKGVAANTNDRGTRVHRVLRGPMFRVGSSGKELEGKRGGDVTLVTRISRNGKEAERTAREVSHRQSGLPARWRFLDSYLFTAWSPTKADCYHHCRLFAVFAITLLGAPSAFTADSLVAAVRSERKLPSEAVPPVCLLEFDGDLTDWMVTAGLAQVYKNWACFHTVMHTIEVDGTHCGIIPRTIGGPYAVLVAEQLKASGVQVILGLTSAGRVGRSLPLPSLVIVEEAIRDEGTSYHYLPPSDSVHSNAELVASLAGEMGFEGLPVTLGRVWTTDAPYRETQQQLDNYAASGVVAVEMQAASLFAFSKAKEIPVGVVALVSNAVDHTEDTFNKGSYDLGKRLIEAMCRSAIRYLKGS